MDALTRSVFRAALPVALSAALVSAASAEPALWRVSDADSAIWLFGSVHILDANAEWRTPAFDQVLGNAEQVFFELVLDEQGMAELGRLALEHGLLPPGETLSALLTADENKRLGKALDEIGLSAMMVEPMQPWMAAITISTAALTQSGAAGDATFSGGIESQLQAEVPDERERGLETPAEQLGLLSTGTREEQVAGLMQAIEELDDANAMFGGLVEAWLRGDVDAIHQDILDSVGATDSEQYRTLITDRNGRWSETAAGLLADNTNALIVVGAAHLAGPEGLPTMLEERGFSVERIDAGQ